MTGWYRCENPSCGGVAYEDGPNTTIKHTEDGLRHVFCRPECYAAWKDPQSLESTTKRDE